ncbi:MAG TPA: indole-3-glycerol phosphate synthase TrpC [Flavisolibacter sp.]|jgi:indole-3-glycerol phosphate synthase|nr:indole-3-glycerol phosphate synthase TrpC [Flavisolibacter sp.]
MNILDKIIAHKREEVEIQKRNKSLDDLRREPDYKITPLSLKQFLLDESKTGIIAEFKRKSPSKGIINDKASVEDVTGAYARLGASGISVLTDETFFGGSINDLVRAGSNQLPLLRKDFMVDEYQIIESKAYGASVILLIAACLSKEKVRELAKLAKGIGLEVLLEIHNEEELDHICNEVDFVGVNNRDLKTFKVDINISLDLIDKIPTSKISITESGISDIEKILTLKKAGFKGFLIGENFMKHADPAIAFAAFVQQLKANYEG